MLKFFAIFLGLLISVSAGPSDPEIKPNNTNWLITHERFVNNTLANPSIPIIFYGDSITSHWEIEGKAIFDEYYLPLEVANYGIGGDQTEHLLWRIINGEVQGLSPKLVVLMAGTNNLDHHNNSDIGGGVATLVSTLRNLLPSTKVLVLGVFPRNNIIKYERIVDINRYIAPLHNGVTVFYMDMLGHFSESWGTVPEELFYDGLHLTEAGYLKWAQTMGPLFNQLIA